MAENLKSTHYSDGTAISGFWAYENSDYYASVYGLLYTWDAAMNGTPAGNAVPGEVQGVCPEGWHLPGLAEWETLTDYQGGAEIAGGKMKESGFNHWHEPNTGATNESGFTALPGGYVSEDGQFQVLRYTGFWWSATIEVHNDTNYKEFLILGESIAEAQYWGTSGQQEAFSVRCLKDNTLNSSTKYLQNNLILYPNPANNRIFFQGITNYSSAEFFVYNMNGTLIYQKNNFRTENAVDISFLNSGIYLIKLVTNSGIKEGVFIKK